MTENQLHELVKVAAFGKAYPNLAGFLADYAHSTLQKDASFLEKRAGGLGSVLKWGLLLGGLGLGGKYLYDNNETARNFIDSLTKKETYQNLWDKAKGLFSGKSSSSPSASADAVAGEIGAQAAVNDNPVFQEQ